MKYCNNKYVNLEEMSLELIKLCYCILDVTRFMKKY